MQPKIKPTIPFTQAAYTKNQQEFDRLTRLRKEVIERLKVAREMGDLSENGAYTAAKFELGSIGRQLRQLKHLLIHGYVATTNAANDTADFGKKITVTDGSSSYTFQLVSEFESNLAEQKLSLESPIGKAVFGNKVNDVVNVQSPSGEKKYTITAIE